MGLDRLEYRRLNINDINLILDMENNFRKNFVKEDNVKAFVSETNNWLYACIDLDANKIVGFTYGYQLKRLNDIGDMLYLHEVGVLDNYQHLGIGSQILNNLKEICKKNKLARIFLFSEKSNLKACKLYEKMRLKKAHDDDVFYYINFYE